MRPCSMHRAAVLHAPQPACLARPSALRTAGRSLRPSTIRKIAAHKLHMQQSIAADPQYMDSVVYVDAAALVQTDFNQSTGLSSRGQRAPALQPSDRGKHYEVLAGINRRRGVMAPFVFEGKLSPPARHSCVAPPNRAQPRPAQATATCSSSRCTSNIYSCRSASRMIS